MSLLVFESQKDIPTLKTLFSDNVSSATVLAYLGQPVLYRSKPYFSIWSVAFSVDEGIRPVNLASNTDIRMWFSMNVNTEMYEDIING